MNRPNGFARLRPVDALVLRGIARPALEALTIPQLEGAIRSLWKTMRACGGTGLAAPQLGLPFRIAVLKDSPGLVSAVLVDPTFEHLGKKRELVEGEEGCLSLPGKRYLVKRYPAIKVHSHVDPRFPVTYIFRGFLARVAQHEYDHLDGRLIDTTGTEIPLEQKEAS